MIGNTVGTVMYQRCPIPSLGGECESSLERYADEQRLLGERLTSEQEQLVDRLRSATSTYVAVLDRAFSPDVEIALAGSVRARDRGRVASADILDSDEKTAAYFLD